MGISCILPFLITGAGIYFLIKLRGFFIFHPIRTARAVISECKKPKVFSSLMLALAGTLGVGNIVGVAVGISIGGAGSVFWLLISSLFSSVIKYAEVTVAYGQGEGGGMIGVISKSFRGCGKAPGIIYGTLTVILSLTMGSALQSVSISDIGLSTFNISPYVLVIPFIIFLVFIISGGADKIENSVKYIIPLTTIVYIFMCLCVIIPNISSLGYVINSIVTSAFSPLSARGGAIGLLTSLAIREGFARGMLSNEAGAGTSALAHARAEGEAMSNRGIFGMVEVFFDTVVLCPLTAFAILFSGCEGEGGIELIINAFAGKVFFDGGLILICISLFALSTILCWYYYGSYSSLFVFGEKSKYIFAVMFILSSVFGLFFDTEFLIAVSDTTLTIMSIFTLAALIYNRRKITYPQL